MWLIVFMIIIIAAVIVCFSLAAAAKNRKFYAQTKQKTNRKCENQGILLTQFELK